MNCLHLPLLSLKMGSRKTITMQFGRTSFTNSNFIRKAPELWNVLPDNIKQCSAVKGFKSKLKKHLLQKFISDD